MTELLQTILLRVTIAGAVSAMALKLAGGGALKEVVRTAAGLLMLLALLQPLAGLHGAVVELAGERLAERHRRNAGAQHADHDEHGRGEHCEGGAAACGGSRYSVHGECGDGE